MPDRSHLRIRRYAAWSLVQLVAVVAAAVADPQYALPVWIVVFLPTLFAWGHVQAEVQLNPRLDEDARVRWRIALWVLPGAMALYWWRCYERRW
jgi:hypothetical protein